MNDKKLLKQACSPIIIAIGIFYLSLLTIVPGLLFNADMYESYGLSEQLPLGTKNITKILLMCRESFSVSIVTIVVVFTITTLIYLAWRQFAKNKIEKITENVEENVKHFSNKATLILSLSVIFFGLIYGIIIFNALYSVYVGSFYWEAYNM